MKNLTRSVVGFVAVSAAIVLVGSATAIAQHNCGGMMGGMSHGDHEESAQQAQKPEPVQPVVVDGVQVMKIVVTSSGYTPARIAVRRDMPVRLVFEQRSSSACASQVQIPDLDVPKTTLPKGKETTIEFTPTRTGEFRLTCGMEMLSGTVVVE